MADIPEIKPEGYFYSEMPPARHIEKVIKAGNKNPFISQFFSVLISKMAQENTLNAPVEFIVCADIYKVVKIFEKQGKADLIDEKSLFMLSLQDAMFAVHSMSLEASNCEMDSFYITPDLTRVKRIRKEWFLPEKVVPIVSLTVGYSSNPLPEHVPFPEEFIFFEDEYPAAKDFLIDELSFHLDNETELIDYYKSLDRNPDSKSEKAKWTWFDLLSNNCNLWKSHLKEFKAILKECGLSHIKFGK